MGLLNNLLIIGIILGILISVRLIYKNLFKKDNIFFVNCYVKSSKSNTNMTVPIIVKDRKAITSDFIKSKLEKLYAGTKFYTVDIQSVLTESEINKLKPSK